MSTFVGIDLGTTNSVVAYRNSYGRPEVIANREGQNITPSVIYFGTDPPAVGQEAKEWARLGNEEIASFFKPHMGNPLYRLQFHGRDYDATGLSAKFAGQTGIEPLDDSVALNEGLVRSEQAKWALSERTSARITLQLGPERRSYELTRAEFESMTYPLMDRTRRLTEEALGEAKVGWNGLSGVLLVGGSTRMPMVRSYVTQMAGAPPRTGVNVDA